MPNPAPGSLASHVTVVLESEARLTAYVPRALSEWDLDSSGTRRRVIDGTLCFVDISGFTTLSERLARRGRIGAEELTDVLDRVFGKMLRLAYDRGGGLLKFGGDALLLLFEGPDHPLQAASAAVEMRTALREATRSPTSVGRISLRMSVGLHTGSIDVFRVGRSHRELVITGPAATTTTQMEKAAEANEILVSPSLRDVLSAGAAPVQKGPGWLLRWRKPPVAPSGVVGRRQVEPGVAAQGVPSALRHHLAQGRAESEHRVASVGFVQFRGVGALLAEGGPDAVAEELDRLVGAVQQAADEEGVTFLSTDIDEDGGKVILVAGVPATQEDDEGRVLRAARRIVEMPCGLEVRVGVNRGHVFAGEVGTDFRSTYTVMGDTVNLAARLMAAAPAGSVYASPSVLDRSRTRFETVPLEPFRVKGKAAPVQAYAVGVELGTREVRSHGELPFAGRVEELSRLVGALERLGSGAGTVVSLVGDTGIGKSRLVEEALARVGGLPLLQVRAEPYGTANPYHAFRDPIRKLLGVEHADQPGMRTRLHRSVAEQAPDLLPMLPLLGAVAQVQVPDTPATAAIEPRFRPDRIADTVERLLATLHHDCLVILAEDAHWMDEASSQLLHRLAGAVVGRPWALLVTARQGGEGFLPSVGEVMELGPLDVEETRGVVLAATEAAPLRPHETDDLVRRSGGNPLFLQELVRVVRETGSADSLPDSLDAVVSAEIDALPPLPRRLLRYASVLGRSFRREVLDGLLAPEGVELDAATRRALARFIEPDGAEGWTFRHAMLRDAAYEGLSYRKRRELHQRAGEVVERVCGSDAEDSADLLGLHYALSGGWDKAWRYARVAGDRAKAAYANVEAATHYERAIEAGRRTGLGGRELAAVWADLGEVRELAGLYDGAVQAYRMASRLASDPVEKAEMLLKGARARMHAGSYRTALAEATRGLRLLEGRSSPAANRVRARVTALRALLRQAQQRAADALALAERAIVEAEAAADDEALARAYLTADWSHFVLGNPEKAVHSEKALAIYEGLHDLYGAGNVLNNLGGVAYFEGRWNEAVERYLRAQEAYERAGDDVSAALAGANIGEVLVSQRRLEEAEPILAHAVRVLRAASAVDDAIFAEMQMGRLLLERGDLEDAIVRLESLRTLALEVGQSGFALEASMHLAFALVADRRPQEALALLEDAAAGAGEIDPLYSPTFARARAAALAALGHREEALRLVEEGVAMAGEQELPYEEALLLLAKVELARRGGDEPSTDDLRRVEELLDRCGVRRSGAPHTAPVT